METVLNDAAVRRSGPHGDDGAAAIVSASRSTAARLAEGATLRITGAGLCAVDAAHVAVEFLHPAIVGKRAVPSLALAPAHVVGDGTAIVLGLLVDGDAEVRSALARARDAGHLTVALHGGQLRPAVDHAVALPGDDPLLVREAMVTAYHLLWEAVHEHLDITRSGDDDGGDLAGLYPFLYGDGDGGGGEELDEHVQGSTARKLAEVAELRARTLADHRDALLATADAIGSAGTVWTFGNGGSCTDAQAIAQLLRSGALAGSPVRSHALTDDVASVTALANDVSFDVVFARLLRTLGRPGDIAVAFSTSGSSTNVLAGLEAARGIGMRTVGFAGYDGGDMAASGAVDDLFVVPSTSVHRIQEAQTTLAHVLVELVRRRDA
jgi:D-sedoheptulose 7-phosphate isomerase